MTVFEELNSLNVNGHTEKKKSGKTELTYLSWPWAWAEVKKKHEDAHYEIWKDEKGLPYICDPQTGYMVYTSVTIDGITHEMWLPVMDGANNAMKTVPYEYTVNNPNFKYAKWDANRQGYYDSYGNRQEEKLTKRVEAATMFDVNKAIMRCLVKNLAMFGLGLYIYAGEDLPETAEETPAQEPKFEAPQAATGAVVSMANKVPQPAPAAPQVAPQAPKQLNSVGVYLNQQMAEMKKKIQNFDFVTARKTLIAGGVIDDIKSKDLTMADAEKMCRAIWSNFGGGDVA